MKKDIHDLICGSDPSNSPETKPTRSSRPSSSGSEVVEDPSSLITQVRWSASDGILHVSTQRERTLAMAPGFILHMRESACCRAPMAEEDVEEGASPPPLSCLSPLDKRWKATVTFKSRRRSNMKAERRLQL